MSLLFFFAAVLFYIASIATDPQFAGAAAVRPSAPYREFLLISVLCAAAGFIAQGPFTFRGFLIATATTGLIAGIAGLVGMLITSESSHVKPTDQYQRLMVAGFISGMFLFLLSSAIPAARA